jgi:hypothetical protein
MGILNSPNRVVILDYYIRPSAFYEALVVAIRAKHLKNISNVAFCGVSRAGLRFYTVKCACAFLFYCKVFLICGYLSKKKHSLRAKCRQEAVGGGAKKKRQSNALYVVLCSLSFRIVSVKPLRNIIPV